MARDDGWTESTEGDLDPDLTEEAGYTDWEPTSRALSPALVRILALALLLAILLPVLLLAFR